MAAVFMAAIYIGPEKVGAADITPNGVNQGDLVKYLGNVRDQSNADKAQLNNLFAKMSSLQATLRTHTLANSTTVMRDMGGAARVTSPDLTLQGF